MSGINEITKAILSRKHPDYDEYLEQWDMFEDTYRGGRQWFDKHIHKYHKEGEEEFKTRVKRAVRFNHPKEIVDLVGKYLFRAEANRKKDAPDAIKQFWKQMSKRKWPVEEFMPVLNKWASVYGRIWVVIDSTNMGGQQGISRAEAKEAGYRVWSHWVRPQDMMDCEYDEDGELNWILLRESYRVNASSHTLVNSGERTRYRVWTRREWKLYEFELDAEGAKTGNLKETDSGQHDLDIVPVVPLDSMTSNEDYTSESLIADIAYLDQAVANYMSCLDAIIQDQTFSQLAMPAQAGLFGHSDDEAKQRDLVLTMGKKRVFLYDGEGGAAPFFLSPDPKQAELIITAIKQIINEIYHSVGVAGERTKQDNSQGIDNSSGVAKAYDFDRVNSLLSNKGKALERFENKVCQIVMLWNGQTLELEDDDKLVCYPDSYDVRGLTDEINISERLEAISAPLKVRQYQMKRTLKKLYPFLDKKTLTELEKSIDDMEDLLTQFNQGVDSSAMSNALPNEQNQEENSDEKK